MTNVNDNCGTIGHVSLRRTEKAVRRHAKHEKVIAIWNEYLSTFAEYRHNVIEMISTQILNNAASNVGVRHNEASIYARDSFDAKYSVFLVTSQFFLGKDKTVYSRWNKDFFFTKDNYCEIFNRHGYHYPPMRLIDLLYQLLSLTRDEHIFWQYERYKRANNAIDCIFDNPDFFVCYEDNIYLNTGTKKTLLNVHTYQDPVKFNNFLKDGFIFHGKVYRSFDKLQRPSLKQFRSIMSMIRPYATKHNNLEINRNSKQGFLQLIVQYLHQRHGMFTNYSSRSNLIISNEARELWQFVPGYMNASSALDDIPISFIKYLLMLTEGNLANIDQIAKLIARINLEKTYTEKNEKSLQQFISPKLIIAITPNINLLQKLLSEIYFFEQTIVKNMSYLCSDKGVIESTNFKICEGILQVIEKSSDISEKDLKRLSKFIQSIPVKIKDNAVGQIRYTSNSQYLMVVEKFDDLNMYSNFLSNFVEILPLQGRKVEEMINNEELRSGKKKNNTPAYLNITNFPQLSQEAVFWLITVFTIYGLILLWEEDLSASKSSAKMIDNKQIVEAFIEECCTQSELVDCYADELYNAYKQFFSYNYKATSMKRTHLVNMLKLNTQYRYCRLRHSANDNKWGFRGITVNKEKMQKYNLYESNDEQNFSKIKDYLKGINKKIIPLFT
ncbi:hypothetical protein [Dendrosporobacter sp. 1207_IL3150]|uniref:hypothetical protein n=1 Tax=Dendrosporobacter sp. 1207_IL3150 TaxID=3084054 RepID=UPI002FD98BEA